MRRLFKYCVLISICLLVATEAYGQRGRFGGGGGGRLGGNLGGGGRSIGGNLGGNLGSGRSLSGNLGGGSRLGSGSVRSGGSVRGSFGGGDGIGGGSVRSNLGGGERIGSGNLGGNFGSAVRDGSFSDRGLGDGSRLPSNRLPAVTRETNRIDFDRFSGGEARSNLGDRATGGQVREFLDQNGTNRGTLREGIVDGDRSGALQRDGAVAEFFRDQRPGADGLERRELGDLGNRTDVLDRANLGDRANIMDRGNIDRANIGDRSDWGNRALLNPQPLRIENRQDWYDWRIDRRRQIVGQVVRTPYYVGSWFTQAYWNRYPYLRWQYRPGLNYWGWATVSTISRWLHFGWARPAYYYYGDNVYYRDNYVYYNQTPMYTVDQYVQQAEIIASSVPHFDEEALEWLPLGVFALVRDGEASGPEPTMFLQLAVSREGIISGTLQNTLTDRADSIEGMVDPQSQRAAWVIVGQDRPLMETGINNLSEDTAPLLIHYADGATQQWLLVRLEAPE